MVNWQDATVLALVATIVAMARIIYVDLKNRLAEKDNTIRELITVVQNNTTSNNALAENFEALTEAVGKLKGA